MKVSLITCHTPLSKRKAGFHWIANSFHRKGWEVNFITTYSLVDIVKKDYRFDLLKNQKFNHTIKFKENFYGHIAFRWWRPFNTKNKYFNKITEPIFKRYGSWKGCKFYEAIKNSDVIVFESLYDLLYFPEVKKRNPKAKYIYRVSDDLTTFNIHRFMINAEEIISPEFDLISVPNEAIHARFSKFCNPLLQPHGIPKYLFDESYLNPYSGDRKKAIFVGNMSFDYDFLNTASKAFSNIDFHIIGPIDKMIKAGNVFYHGEIPYEDTIRYIKHADLALSPRTLGSLMNSNKIMQYKYCNLPIVISDFNKDESEGGSIFYYSPGDKESIIRSMQGALSYERAKNSCSDVMDWDDLVANFLK